MLVDNSSTPSSRNTDIARYSDCYAASRRRTLLPSRLTTLPMFFLLLAGCMDSTHFAKDNANAMPEHSSYYVALPDDGMYGAKVYSGSGKMTRAIIKAALQRNSQSAAAATHVEERNQALDSARQGGYDYLALPTILHWEDRATEWDFLRDKVEVKIELIDVFSGKTESSTIIEGKSGTATLGGDHPQDLLPEPINEYFDAVLKGHSH